MDKDSLKIKIKLIKKPKIYTPINLKEIDIHNDLKNNNIFIVKKYKSLEKQKKAFKKHDIRHQILSQTYSLNEYTKKSKKNFNLINELKSFNDYLISELNNKIEKSQFFNKKTEDVFHDLVVAYNNKGYKIPNLSRSHNLFKRNPLLIENKKDVEIYYQEDPSTKGTFIRDMNNYKEKNWVFLNKVNKQCNKAKAYFESKAVNVGGNMDILSDYNNAYSDSKCFTSIEKKKIKDLKNDINQIKNLIEKEKENEKKIILSYNSKNKENLDLKRKKSESLYLRNSFNKTFDYKGNLLFALQKLTSKNLNHYTPYKKKLSFMLFNKNRDNIKRQNSKFNLITEVNKKINNKNEIKANSDFNKTSLPIKTIRIPESNKLKKEIKSYLEKYDNNLDKELLKESYADILNKIQKTKLNIKKKDIFKIRKGFLFFSKKKENKLKLVENLENQISNLDKTFIMKCVIKGFEDDV